MFFYGVFHVSGFNHGGDSYIIISLRKIYPCPSCLDLNQYLIKAISRDLLGIETSFRDSREYRAEGKKLDRLIDLLKKAGAEAYVSGPAAKSYIEETRFSEAGIELIWKSYSGYPEYSQSHPPFEHGVSVLDLLFQTGPDAGWHIWGWREDR